MISLRAILNLVLYSMLLILVAQAYVLSARAATPKTALAKVASSTSAQVSKVSDQTKMKNARLLFEKKKFQDAIKVYQSVSSGSDLWSEALEEEAWAHLHLKEHDEALALLKTLMAPPMKNEIGPEPYLLLTLIQLRLCDYDEVFKVLKRFKDDIKPRYEALKAIAKDGTSLAFERILSESAASKSIERSKVGADIKILPKAFYRDSILLSSLKRGLSPKPRMKVLASRDVSEIESVLRKLHLIEVESVQRMHSQLHLADAVTAPKGIERNANTLVFPDDEDDVWLDELNNYRVNAKGCPQVASVRGS